MAKTDNKHLEDFVSGYKSRFEGYSIDVQWPDCAKQDPNSEAVDIVVKIMDGSSYYSTFLTRKYIDYLFEKNKRTGECSGGIYFAMPRFVILEKLTDQNIRKVIDDIIYNLEFEDYFSKETG